MVIPMNLMSNSTEIAGALIGEPSFADAMAAIEKAEDLLPNRSAIGAARFARWHGTLIGRFP